MIHFDQWKWKRARKRKGKCMNSEWKEFPGQRYRWIDNDSNDDDEDEIQRQGQSSLRFPLIHVLIRKVKIAKTKGIAINFFPPPLHVHVAFINVVLLIFSSVSPSFKSSKGEFMSFRMCNCIRLIWSTAPNEICRCFRLHTSHNWWLFFWISSSRRVCNFVFTLFIQAGAENLSKCKQKFSTRQIITDVS